MERTLVITLKMPVNFKLTMPRKLPRQLLEPILKPLWRGPKTAGTALHDRIALHKSLFLCAGCQYKMNPRHLKALHYEELRQFHGLGLCDGCQMEFPGAMWMWQGSAHIRAQDQEAEWQRVRERDRQVYEKWRRR